MSANDLNTRVVCQICHQPFSVTRNDLEEKTVVLQKEGLLPCVATLTIVHCPRCGKQYVVSADTVEIKDLVQQLTELHAKRARLQQKGFKVHPKLDQNYAQLERKINFKRKQVAGEYTGSFYQTEDGKEQLDYHYHG